MPRGLKVPGGPTGNTPCAPSVEPSKCSGRRHLMPEALSDLCSRGAGPSDEIPFAVALEVWSHALNRGIVGWFNTVALSE